MIKGSANKLYSACAHIGNMWTKPGLRPGKWGESQAEGEEEKVPLLCWKLTAADAGRIAMSAAAAEMMSSATLMPHLRMQNYSYLRLGPHL